jgi:pimeloyl-ACP methyl ester carboxylesterase
MRDLVLVVHSGGGPVGQLIAAAAPQRIAAMVFVDAWVLTGGSGQECIADLLPPTLAPLIDVARRGEPIPMDPGVWFAEFAQDATEAARRVGGPRVAATPCPPDWVTAALNWRPFWDLLNDGLFPTYYLFLDQDRAVPTEVYQQMAQRLRPAGTGRTRGSHQGFHRYYAEFTDALVHLCSRQTETTSPREQ